MRRALILVLSLLVVVMIVLAVILVLQVQKPRETVNATPTPVGTSVVGMPQAQGTQLVIAGHQLLLQGAQIESPFNYIKRWDSGEDPTALLNSKTFDVMAHDWHMNALRLPLSNWIYAKDTTNYMNKLDQVVQQANASGLYVVLDLHDDDKAGSPYGKNATYPKVEDLNFWKAIATHYKDNPMVMFDVFNEPKIPNWDAWLHGVSGTKELGFQDLVNGIRSVGAKQAIVVEPGSAGGGTTQGGGWTSFPVDHAINDPNIIYSEHIYSGLSSTPQKLDAKWGPILNRYPIYYGEWAFLPNANSPSQCSGVSHDAASSVVMNFLNYMASRHANWTAWAFTPKHLIQNANTYQPTALNVPWTCGETNVDAGMGAIVKQFLDIHS